MVDSPRHSSESTAAPPSPGAKSSPGANDSYVVVARRYRPQNFNDLVGQQQVSQALRNAITTNRVGHAYLFTGARGVGKTSSARILAKALNCQQGPTPEPCGECDICLSIAAGEDVDVLEIDGASNRGIDEIRQLRSNAGVRPSRARYKIYIIDEVHMLTTPAFNALLKTLEEPPEHVKFLFCTTDPEKIPVTVLSRCQRFDFAPVDVDSIVTRLQFIVDTEGASAEREALQLLARRAGGSMRDSQSLLEQLLSFCDATITVTDVHAMLGTADSGRLGAICEHLIGRDAAAALKEIDTALSEGVDAGQLAEQVEGYLRDMMAAAVGCSADMMRFSTQAEFEKLQAAGKAWGVQTLLASIQVLDQAVVGMRHSANPRMLLEIAVVRICSLQDLDEIAGLIARLEQGGAVTAAPTTARTAPRSAALVEPPPSVEPSAPAEKKTEKPSDDQISPVAEKAVRRIDLSPESATEIWTQTLAQLEDMTADFAGYYDRVAIRAPNRLAVCFRAEYTLQKESCERPERKAKIEDTLARLTGQTIRVDFEILPADKPADEPKRPVASRRQRMREKEKHPFVRQAMELFDAEMLRLEEHRASDDNETG